MTLTATSGLSAGEGRRQPRICVPTVRRFSRMAFQCGHLEAQDVLAECANVDLIELEATPRFSTTLRWLRRLMYRDVSRRLAYVNPGLKPVRLTKDYDLLVIMCQGYWDFLNVNAIENWKDRCKTSICWIDEVWAADVPFYKYWLPSLRRFDHVVVGFQGSVAAVSDMLERPCHYVPAGVDTLRFSPWPDPPERVLDVYSVGRKAEGLHRALLDLAAKQRIFYQYDTLQTGISEAPDHREHRDLYANIAKRSRYFLVAPGKANMREETQGQIEPGFRYYEGSAAGAVMLGQAADCEAFRTMFDWPDAVIEVKPDGTDVAGILAELAADPARVARAGRRNSTEALLRHDWIYRWKRILEIAALESGPGMTVRETALRNLAGLGSER